MNVSLELGMIFGSPVWYVDGKVVESDRLILKTIFEARALVLSSFNADLSLFFFFSTAD